MTADLAVTSAYLVDLNANPISEVVEGERALVRVNYTTTDLTSDMQYVIQFEMGGIATESQVITGMPGTNLQYYRFRYAGYASPGTQQVRVTLDAANQVAESNESNNTITFNFTPVKPDLTQKFILPVTGTPSEDWTILNLHDVDLRVDHREDFSGGFLQYDGHAAWDIFVANFNQMDDGVPVHAAASGTVIETGDGNFDREDFWDFTLPDPRIPNYVIIDHGDGWQTAYHHLMRDTVAVEVGQQVVANQTLGLIASSGISDGPHVHFAIRRNGVPVEPMYALDDYFIDPPEYLGDRAPKVTVAGISNASPVADFKELPNDVRQFELGGTVNPWLWYRLEYVRSGDVISTEWRRPNGALYSRFDWTASDDIRYLRFWAWDTAIQTPGQWTVVSYHSGIEVVRETFFVSSTVGTPEIDLRQEDVYIIDGRSTPIDFGRHSQAASAPTKVFTVNNIGTATLRLSNLQLPDGFELVGGFPSAVASGGSANFRVRMLTSNIDHHWGDIRFTTNDADESQFTFSVEGMVTGNRIPNAPVLTDATTALAIEAGLAAARVFPTLTITDSDSATFGGSKLIANIASGRDDTGTDRLMLLPASADIRFHRDTVLYQEDPIATVIKNGSDGEIEVLFTSEVSNEVVEQVARSIAFWQQQLDTTSRRRTVDLQLIDPTGLTSNTSRRAVFYADAVFNHPPQIDPLVDRTLDEDMQLSPVVIQVQDLNHPIQGLTIESTSSNQSLVPTANITTSYSNGQWSFDLSPSANEFGTTDIAIVVTDGDGIQARSSFELTVNSINDLPTVSTIPAQSIKKGNSPPQATFQVDDVETPASDLQLVGSSSNADLIDASGIVFGGADTNRTITLTPKPNQIGEATITVEVSDTHGGTKSTDFTFAVNPESQPPTITSVGDQQTMEDEPFTVSFTVNDNETPADEIEMTATSINDLFTPASFEFTGVGEERTLQLTPTANKAGQSEIVLSATDNVGNVARTTFTATVTAVNDAPTFQVQEQVATNEDAPEQMLSINAITAGGGETQPLQFNVVAAHPSLFESLEVNYTSGQTTAEINWKSASNVFGEAKFMVTATDGGLDGDLNTTDDNGQTTRTVTVDIAAVNDPPTIDLPAQVEVDEDSGEQVTSLSAITAGGGEAQMLKLSVLSLDTSFFEQLSVDYTSGNPTASLNWKPASNVWGNVDVQLKLEDAGLDGQLETTADNGITIETLSITVAPINDPPDFQFNASAAQPEDSATISEALFNITSGPVESDTLDWNIETLPANGLASVSVVPGVQSSNATLRWNPSPDFSGNIDVILSLTDAGLDGNLESETDNLTTTKTISLTVSPVNDAPEGLILPTGTFSESATSGVVGEVTAIDRDPGDTHTFTTNDDRFAVVDGELRLVDGAQLDFETEPRIFVGVTVTDSADESISNQATITITDANEAPSAVTIEDYVLYEELLGQSIGKLTVTDQDLDQSHTIESLDDRFEVTNGILQLKSDNSIVTDDNEPITIQLRVSDSGEPAITEDLELQLQTTTVDSPWKNQANELDVDGDTIIAPIDVLLVINHLNAGGSTMLDAVDNPPHASGPYLDVSGDRFVSPLDPLLVINWLNGVAGEGESRPLNPGMSLRLSHPAAMLESTLFLDHNSAAKADTHVAVEYARQLDDYWTLSDISDVSDTTRSYKARGTTAQAAQTIDLAELELRSIDEVFAAMEE